LSAGLADVTAPAASAAPLRVQILRFDGMEEQDFVEVLGLAGKLTGGAVVTSLVSAGGARRRPDEGPQRDNAPRREGGSGRAGRDGD